MIGVKHNKSATDALFEHYKNQIFKMLGLFESKDINGYRFADKIQREISHLPNQFPKLNDDYKFKIVLTHLDIISNELQTGELTRHRIVKNNVMECCNLMESIKVGLR